MNLENYLTNLNVYKNTCCSCCGIPRISPKYYLKPDGTKVQATVDHNLLASLGGTHLTDNLNNMCFDCNQLRGNLFAEFDQFIEWYWSDKELPKEKNFSYIFADNNTISEHEMYCKKAAYNKIYRKYFSNKVQSIVPKDSKKSEEIDVVELNGVKYKHYKHPLFGNSLIKM